MTLARVVRSSFEAVPQAAAVTQARVVSEVGNEERRMGFSRNW